MKQYQSLNKYTNRSYWKKQIIVRLPKVIYQIRFKQNEYGWNRLYYRFSKGKTAKKVRTAYVSEAISQFNFWVFNKVLGMIGYFEEMGYYYQIDISAQEEGFDVLKQFLELNDCDVDDVDVQYDLGDTTIWNLDQFDVYDRFDREMMCRIYQRNFHLSNFFAEYFEEDMNVIRGKTVLGVLMRGTDYTSKKPSGHPIQPEKKEVLAKIL